ncbi:helix-turn-helix transcriptional regulator [uncultured Leifsonia sp.]|uniref:helix-turn-helix transcriptional regulator n=1 Tax=uncultured Leifsonia sp. TaxID=340359 RepID=UPI0025E41184|nr:helix-turn-helix transcriptional regulator [uncultured Leifsonia sp.]
MNEDEVARIDALAEDLVAEHRILMQTLVAHRKAHELTQETVAERMGVSQPTVAAFERYDANPTLSTIRRYALAVGAGIRHHVDDRCSDPETELRMIAAGSDFQWQHKPVLGWSQSAVLETKLV